MIDVQTPTPPTSPAPAHQEHRVLARKYRPQTFSDMIGQDVLVKTLSHAISTGRLAHAWMLTGVRGVGKTTTARIIARALNCTGSDGTRGPTITPCGVCTSCTAIAADRHVDIAEMDAASRTGVGDIRDILDGVRYRPISARYKIYIIDEVHMLSQAAFNALLKTLEEPPEHVKFIFATTDTRKVPVTVLSRCQRFDLRRVGVKDLAAHLQHIANQESVTTEIEALQLIAEAADGSVRDGLSLLDQAIVYGAGEVTQTCVLAMIGLANREDIFSLLESLFSADLKKSFERLARLYEAGADPMAIVSDLQDRVHKITVLKALPDLPKNRVLIAGDSSAQDMKYAEHLSMAFLTRTWHMLVKIQDEIRLSTHPLRTLEMGLLRLAYAADTPTPNEILSRLRAQPTQVPYQPPAPPPSHKAPTERTDELAAPHRETTSTPPPSPMNTLPTFENLIHWLAEKREVLLAHHLEHSVSLIHYEPGRIDFRPLDQTPPDLAQKLDLFLEQETGMRWRVGCSQEGGETTVHDKALAEITAHPLVKTALEVFPSAEVRPLHHVAEPLT